MSIVTTRDGESLILKIGQTSIDPQIIREARKIVDGNSDVPMIVLDFSKVESVSVDSLPSIVQFSAALEARGARLMIMLKQELAKTIEKHTTELTPTYLLVSGKKTATQKTSGEVLDSIAVQTTILNSLAKTLEAYVHVAFQVGEPFHPGGGHLPALDIGATVEVTSDLFSKTIAIGFPKNTYLKLISKLQGKDFKTLSPQIKDWAAEILNVTFGMVKAFVNERNHQLTFNIPRLLDGKKIAPLLTSNIKSVIFPLSTEAGDFYVSILESVSVTSS